VAYATKHIWKKWFDKEEDPVSTVYAALKQGHPEIGDEICSLIGRTDLVTALANIIMPREAKRGYPLVIGERGTGKTSLLRLAVDEIDGSRKAKSRGIVYVRIPRKDGMPFKLSQVIGEALGLDSNRCN
jgi:hypothetical protein